MASSTNETESDQTKNGCNKVDDKAHSVEDEKGGRPPSNSSGYDSPSRSSSPNSPKQGQGKFDFPLKHNPPSNPSETEPQEEGAVAAADRAAVNGPLADSLANMDIPDETFHREQRITAQGATVDVIHIPDEYWPEEQQMSPVEDPFANMEMRCEVIEIPKQFCGLVFGTKGKNLKDLRERYQCFLRLENARDPTRSHALCLRYPPAHHDEVMDWFARKLRSCRIASKYQNSTPIGNPDLLVQRIQVGTLQPVVVLGLTSPNQLLVQPYSPETYAQFQEFQERLDQKYKTYDCPRLPRPVSPGAICVAPYADGRFYRAKIIKLLVNTEGATFALVQYLDFGGTMFHEYESLMRISSEFMNFPFQTVTLEWAHAFMLYPMNTNDVFGRYFFNRVVFAYVVAKQRNGIDLAAMFMDLCAEGYGQPPSNCLMDILGRAVLDGFYGLEYYAAPNCHPRYSSLLSRYSPPELDAVHQIPYWDLWWQSEPEVADYDADTEEIPVVTQEGPKVAQEQQQAHSPAPRTNGEPEAQAAAVSPTGRGVTSRQQQQQVQPGAYPAPMNRGRGRARGRARWVWKNQQQQEAPRPGEQRH